MTEATSGPTPPSDEPTRPNDQPSQPPQWEERDAWTALDDLDASPALVPASEWPAGATGLDRPGLFAFWASAAGAAHLSRGLDLPLEPGRIYAGQAGATKWPSGKASDDSLGHAIARVHLGGKVRMSAFRWTLAAILFAQLELQGQAAMLITPSSEQALGEWMGAHLSVAVHAHDDRDTLGGLERAVVERLDPPLEPEGHLPATLAARERRSPCARGSAGRADHPQVLAQVGVEHRVQLAKVVCRHLDEREREHRVAVEVGRAQLEHAAEAGGEAVVVDRLDRRDPRCSAGPRRSAPWCVPSVSSAMRASPGARREVAAVRVDA